MKTQKQKKINIHSGHRSRVRDKYKKSGIDAFSEHEVLEFLLFYTKAQADTNALAHELINTFGSLTAVLDAPISALTQVEGVGESTAIYLNLLRDVIKIYNLGKSNIPKNLSTVSACYNFAVSIFKDEPIEKLYVICVNANNNIISYKKIAEGTSDSVSISVRSITDFILSNKCSRVLLMHNHPSEVSSFSDEDFALTHTIFSSCILNGIDIVDHILYTRNGCYRMGSDSNFKLLKTNVMEKLGITEKSVNYLKAYAQSKPIVDDIQTKNSATELSNILSIVEALENENKSRQTPKN